MRIGSRKSMPGEGAAVLEQQGSRKQAFLDKTRYEIDNLTRQGVVLAGNAFAQVLFAKGQLDPGELDDDGRKLLAGQDGKALRASLAALGYEPQDWAALSTLASDGKPLEPHLVRLTVTTLDPPTLVACDEAAAHALREAYADELVALDDFDAAMLAPGVVSHVRGMRVMNLGGFEDALADAHQKQIMWARLKKLPPLGEPY